MRLRSAAPLILGATFLVALISVACGTEDFNSIVQTTTAEQKIANVTATAEVLISKGIDPTDRSVAVGVGSVAEQVVQTQEAERVARGGTLEELVALPNGELVAPAVATAFATEGTPEEPKEVPAGAAESGEIIVEIANLGAFTPAVVKITVGSIVTWVNKERTIHSTKSDDNQDEEWDSGSLARSILSKEEPQFSHTFNTPGRYAYGSKVGGDLGRGTVFVE